MLKNLRLGYQYQMTRCLPLISKTYILEYLFMFYCIPWPEKCRFRYQDCYYRTTGSDSKETLEKVVAILGIMSVFCTIGLKYFGSSLKILYFCLQWPPESSESTKALVPDINELIRFWRSWCQRSRSCGTDFDFLKFVQAIYPKQLKDFN